MVVVGDARPWLSAIICLNEEIESERVDQTIRDVLRRYNQDKSSLLQVRKGLVDDRVMFDRQRTPHPDP